MHNLNLNFIQLEQGIKNLISQSQLPIMVVDSILKNISHDIEVQKQSYLVHLQEHMINESVQQEANEEIKE